MKYHCSLSSGNSAGQVPCLSGKAMACVVPGKINNPPLTPKIWKTTHGDTLTGHRKENMPKYTELQIKVQTWGGGWLALGLRSTRKSTSHKSFLHHYSTENSRNSKTEPNITSKTYLKTSLNCNPPLGRHRAKSMYGTKIRELRSQWRPKSDSPSGPLINPATFLEHGISLQKHSWYADLQVGKLGISSNTIIIGHDARSFIRIYRRYLINSSIADRQWFEQLRGP